MKIDSLPVPGVKKNDLDLGKLANSLNFGKIKKNPIFISMVIFTPPIKTVIFKITDRCLHFKQMFTRVLT